LAQLFVHKFLLGISTAYNALVALSFIIIKELSELSNNYLSAFPAQIETVILLVNGVRLLLFFDVDFIASRLVIAISATVDNRIML
jgi:hypothetical protein